MQVSAEVATASAIMGAHAESQGSTAPVAASSSDGKVIRRNGAVVVFEPSKISVAMTRAFLAVEGGQGAASARIRELVASLTGLVVSALVRRQAGGGTFHIEDIQDQVELALMRSGEHEVARSYVLYRQKRAEARASQAVTRKASSGVGVKEFTISVLDEGVRKPMGQSLLEIDREARAIEFYKDLSSFDFMSSTPTLFNAGPPELSLVPTRYIRCLKRRAVDPNWERPRPFHACSMLEQARNSAGRDFSLSAG